MIRTCLTLFFKNSNYFLCYFEISSCSTPLPVVIMPVFRSLAILFGVFTLIFYYFHIYYFLFTSIIYISRVQCDILTHESTENACIKSKCLGFPSISYFFNVWSLLAPLFSLKMYNRFLRTIVTLYCNSVLWNIFLLIVFGIYYLMSFNQHSLNL